MPRYSPERQSFTGTSCSWENLTFESDDDGSQDLEGSLWSRRSRFEYPREYPQSPSRSPNRSLHGQRKRKRSGSVDFSESGPKRSMTADAFQSISSWKYTELLQDNLTLALVDENDDDGCLLRETWPEIEGRLADMVAKRLRAVPQGPNPSFDSSYVIRGHRVIRCLDGFSKIFLEDCLDKIGNAWRGLRIRLVHASQIPCPEAQRIFASTQNVEQAEENSFGWILPRGAQMSDAAIQEIQFRRLNNPKGQQKQFLLKDGSTIWRVNFNRDHEVHILEHIPPAEEVDHMEEGEQMSQVDEIFNTEVTEVNSFGWIVPAGAQFSDTAIQQIRDGLIKAKGKRMRFLVFDGLKAWKVLVSRGDRVSIRQYTGSAVRKEPSSEIEETEQSMVIDQSEQREDNKQTMLIDEMEDTPLTEGTKELIKSAEINNTEEISQANETELTEINHLGWTVPRGAQFSDTAIEQIKNFIITAKGKRKAFSVFDGLKAWRVLVSRGDRVSIRQYTRCAVRQDPLNEIEETEQSMVIDQSEQREDSKQTMLIDETEDTQLTEGTKELIKSAEINNTEEISQANETELTEINHLGWTVPLGAQFSDSAIQQIKNFIITSKGKRKAFLVFDDLKAWKVLVRRDDRVSIRQYTGSAVRKEPSNETEETEQSMAIDQSEQRRDIEKTMLIDEKEDAEGSKQAKEMIQTAEIYHTEAISPGNETELTEVNHLGWTVPRGALFSDSAIQQIKNFIIKANGKRMRSLVFDDSNAWKVLVSRGNRVSIRQYTGSAVRKEPSNEIEDTEQSMAIDQSEQRKDIEKTMLIDEKEDTELNEGTKELIKSAEINNTDEITQANETELTEVNQLGWTVPLGAQLSDSAIQQIKNSIIKANGKRMRSLVFDGLKAWRVQLTRGDRVRIRQCTRSGVRKEPSNEVDDTEQSMALDQSEQRRDIEKTMLIDEKKDAEGSKQAKEMIQTAEIHHTEAISPANGTELDRVSIRQYTLCAVRKEPSNEIEERQLMEEIEHSEDREQKEVDKSLVINPKEDTEPEDTKLLKNMADGTMKVNEISPQAKELKKTESANLEDGKNQTMETGQPVVNSLGWILVKGAQPSEAAILEIQPRLLKRTNKTRYRFLVKDGLKTWRVYLRGTQLVRVEPYNRPVDKTKAMEPPEDSQLIDDVKGMEEVHQPEREAVVKFETNE